MSIGDDISTVRVGDDIAIKVLRSERWMPLATTRAASEVGSARLTVPRVVGNRLSADGARPFHHRILGIRNPRGAA